MEAYACAAVYVIGSAPERLLSSRISPLRRFAVLDCSRLRIFVRYEIAASTTLETSTHGREALKDPVDERAFHRHRRFRLPTPPTWRFLTLQTFLIHSPIILTYGDLRLGSGQPTTDVQSSVDLDLDGDDPCAFCVC